MLTDEVSVNGDRYESLFGAPPPASPARDTNRPNCRKSRQFGRLVLDVAQPSVPKIGGITSMMAIAGLAEARGVRLIPHCAYFGPGFLASLHLHTRLAPGMPFERLLMTLEGQPVPRHHRGRRRTRGGAAGAGVGGGPRSTHSGALCSDSANRNARIAAIDFELAFR